MSEQAADGAKQFLNLIWLGIVGCGIAVPKPVMAMWEKLNGNSEGEFAKITSLMPSDQTAFIQSVSGMRADYAAAENDMAKGGLRATRKEKVCASLNGATDVEWVGLVDDLSSNGDGKGVLSIKIAPHLTVSTWNNALSDIGQDTLLEPGSPIHTVAASMKKGDQVKFSGRFFQNDLDCIREKSFTLEGSLSDPDYLVKFENLQRL